LTVLLTKCPLRKDCDYFIAEFNLLLQEFVQRVALIKKLN
jgi:hypothetical protein